MKIYLCRGFLVLACAVASTATAENDDVFFLLTRETASCIASGREELVAPENSIIFIKPHDCSVEPQDNSLTYAPVEAPDVSGLQNQGDANPDALLFLSRKHLACFEDVSVMGNTRPSTDVLWRFYPDTCHFEPDA